MDVITYYLVLLLSFASLLLVDLTTAEDTLNLRQPSGVLRRHLLLRRRRDSCMQWMALSRDCNGHGDCSMDDVGAHCVCKDGWTGTYCQHAPGEDPSADVRNDCEQLMASTKNCNGHGSCVDGADKVYCACQDGWIGAYCQNEQVVRVPVEVDPCASAPCLNDGMCFRAANRNAYKCVCGAGFTGDHCDIAVVPEEIKESPVTSRPQRPSEGSDDVYTEYDVRCAQLFMMSKRCNTHGYCKVDYTGSFCKCFDGWMGSYCNIQDDRAKNSLDNEPVPVTAQSPEVDSNTPAQSNDVVDVRCMQLYAKSDRCSNSNGYCSVDAMGAFCKCYPGWAGTNCQYKVSTMLKMLQDMEEMISE